MGGKSFKLDIFNFLNIEWDKASKKIEKTGYNEFVTYTDLLREIPN